MRGEGERVKTSKVELAENRLILDKLYSTLPYIPSKRTITLTNPIAHTTTKDDSRSTTPILYLFPLDHAHQAPTKPFSSSTTLIACVDEHG